MKKIESIQGFRAVAFLIIFLSHSGAIWHELGGGVYLSLSSSPASWPFTLRMVKQSIILPRAV